MRATGQKHLRTTAIFLLAAALNASAPIAVAFSNSIVPGAAVHDVAEDGPNDAKPLQHFVCNTGYTVKECYSDLAVLKKALAKYPIQQLGAWTWVLVRSGDWKAISKLRRLDPDSPAFTCLELRVTFIEEALVSSEPERISELMMRWHMSRSGLLDLAIAHELAHALCDELSEGKTQRLTQMLQDGGTASCEAGSIVRAKRRQLRQ